MQIYKKRKRKKKDGNDKGWRESLTSVRDTYLSLVLCSSLSASSESENLFFMVGSSSESLRTSSDPSLEDKFASGPRVAELGMDEGVTTREEV